MAAYADSASGRIVFHGGGDNPYNYNGVGYGGRPALPCRQPFAWDVKMQVWIQDAPDALAGMDFRGAVKLENLWWTLGGMIVGAEVSQSVRALPPLVQKP